MLRGEIFALVHSSTWGLLSEMGICTMLLESLRIRPMSTTCSVAIAWKMLAIACDRTQAHRQKRTRAEGLPHQRRKSAMAPHKGHWPPANRGRIGSCAVSRRTNAPTKLRP
eukprot:641282-Rhodomonas_salina.5